MGVLNEKRCNKSINLYLSNGNYIELDIHSTFEY